MNQYKNDDIVILGTARTPIGAYLGGLKTVPVQKLGRIALEGAINRSKLDKEMIDEVIIGNVIGSQTSNNVARIISLDSGLPDTTTAYTLNRVCGSGIQSVINAAQLLKLKEAEVVAAGGVESLSRSPYYLPENARYEGLKLGNEQIIDSNIEGLASVSGSRANIPHMGNTAENIARRYQITRQAQDAFALDSQAKADKAIKSGRLAKEIVSVETSNHKGVVTKVAQDEHPRPDATLSALEKLKPAFEVGGTVTAGNASGLNDGGACGIISTRSFALEHQLPILSKIVDYTIVGLSPEYMGLGPVKAIKKLLQRQNLKLKDIGILEINEAFAAQVLGCLIELGIDTESSYYGERFNPNGGAIALGHPLGMSGSRLIGSITQEFQENPHLRYGIASTCIGGGQGIAILLENMQEG